MKIFTNKNGNRSKMNNHNIKSSDQMTTLELWQTHLRALHRVSSKTTHKVEVFDTTEQTSTSVVVNMTDNSK